MGCFSYKCKECGKGVKSNSFSGEMVKIFLLKAGKVIQMMEGQYNSYGAVFKEGTQRKDVKHRLMESEDWKNPTPDKPMRKGEDTWGRICDLLFSDEKNTGFAFVHTKCFKKIPTTVSERDPNQGWGDPDENDEDLMGNVDPDHKYD